MASGVGWGIAAGYIYGHRRGLAQSPENLSHLQLEVEDTLDKLRHKADRARKREAAAAAEQPTPGGEVLPADRKSDLRRRAAAAGFLFGRPRAHEFINNGGERIP